MSIHVEIHDHFDGSANCIECNGPCRLKNADMVVTELVRWMFDRWARGYNSAGPDHMQRATLERAGVDIERFYRTAVNCNRPQTRPRIAERKEVKP